MNEQTERAIRQALDEIVDSSGARMSFEMRSHACVARRSETSRRS